MPQYLRNLVEQEVFILLDTRICSRFRHRLTDKVNSGNTVVIDDAEESLTRGEAGYETEPELLQESWYRKCEHVMI